jgi:hypothetical protein
MSCSPAGVEVAYMNKCSSNQNAGTKMFANEEDFWGNLKPGHLLSGNWEASSCDEFISSCDLSREVLSYPGKKQTVP